MADQVLSQKEISALLSSLSPDSSEKQASLGESEETAKLVSLTGEERIVRGRLPALELIHERFSRGFRASLSRLLGKTCFVNPAAVDLVKFGAFMKKLPLPSSIHLFRMPPLAGHALLVIDTALVYAIVDSMFGGKGSGRTKTQGREFSSIENRLIAKVVMMALEDLQEAWSSVHPVDFVYGQSEFNPLAVSIASHSDVAAVVNMEVSLEQEASSLSLCIPYATIEPIKKKLSTGIQSSHFQSNPQTTAKLAASLRSTQVDLRAVLGQGSIKVQQLLKLQVGDTIPLTASPGDRAQLVVGGVPKFEADIGKSKGNKAAKVVKAIKSN